jgi:transketolase
MTSDQLQKQAINAIRFLSADGVEQAKSGHPGLPMGTAAMAYTIFIRHLRFNPRNPKWFNRDRFVLSGGHGSMLLYSLLYLTGYDLPLDELKKFRQWGSLTPGHPEHGLTPGVEMTTGPLGQGFSSGVGMALAEAHLASVYNKENYPVVDHFTYAIVTDGDLMEGVASEAASLAGHLQLGKIIYLYDDNRISIEGSTDIAFTEDRGARFEAYGWQVLHVSDGNNVDEIDKAIQQAKLDPRPSLIICRTTIGFGLPNKQGTEKAHGEPAGEAELNAAKENLGWKTEPRFYVPDDVLAHFREAVEKGQKLESDWKNLFSKYEGAYPSEAAAFNNQVNGILPTGWDKELPEFPADPKGMASRKASGIVLNVLAEKIPALMGGSADLAPSNNTWLDKSTAIEPGNYIGRNIHFGVREHGMGAVLNGLALHDGFIPYGATFMVFSDYMRPTIRMSALSDLQVIWVLTHDSFCLGEDGPTHQPVEQIASLRAIPNLVVIRPSDANETREAWKVAVSRQQGPTVLALSRQNLVTLDRSVYKPASNLAKGAYVLADLGGDKPQIILMASGSEVEIIVQAGSLLSAEGINVRLVSFPSWELFKAQPQSYKDSVLPPSICTRIAVEAGISMGWEQWVGSKGQIIALDRFGASAPYKTLLQEFGFTPENVIKQAKGLLGLE